MERTAGQIGAVATGLYPAVEPFDRRMIDMGDGHRIYVEQCGNPAGRPVVVLHGGPGGGASPFMRRFFDPAHYRVVLFDQRGCGRSQPLAAVALNTTGHLVADIEAIRDTLGLGPVLLFGGSWGATLALAHAEAHPTSVSGLILRGVFLGRQAELDWFYAGGAGRFFPELWAEFQSPIPPAERGDLIAAYHRRLFGGDRATEARCALQWLRWENALAGLTVTPGCGVGSDYARVFARLECHYFHNACFIEEGQLLRRRHRIEHLPAIIVQGRYDMICPPHSAFELAAGWNRAELRMIPAAGHALSEVAIATELVRVMDGLRDGAR